MAPSHRRVKPFEHELRELSPLFTNEVRLWSDGALALLLVGVEPYRSGTQMIDVTAPPLLQFAQKLNVVCILSSPLLTSSCIFLFHSQSDYDTARSALRYSSKLTPSGNYVLGIPYPSPAAWPAVEKLWAPVDKAWRHYLSAKDDPFSPEYVPPTAQKLAAPIRVETQTAWSSSSAFSERRKTISKSFDQYRMEQAEASQKAQEMAALDFEKYSRYTTPSALHPASASSLDVAAIVAQAQVESEQQARNDSIANEAAKKSAQHAAYLNDLDSIVRACFEALRQTLTAATFDWRVNDCIKQIRQFEEFHDLPRPDPATTKLVIEREANVYIAKLFARKLQDAVRPSNQHAAPPLKRARLATNAAASQGAAAAGAERTDAQGRAPMDLDE